MSKARLLTEAFRPVLVRAHRRYDDILAYDLARVRILDRELDSNYILDSRDLLAYARTLTRVGLLLCALTRIFIAVVFRDLAGNFTRVVIAAPRERVRPGKFPSRSVPYGEKRQQRHRFVQTAAPARGLVVAASWLLPAALRARYGEEYRSELWDLAAAGAGRRQQLGYALRQFRCAVPLRFAVLSPRHRRAAP
jgi:hypothetical protein